MGFKKATLSQQIFLSIIILISVSLAVVATINIAQVKKDTTSYNIERLARKDRAVAKSIEAMVDYSVDLDKAFEHTLYNIGQIHKLKINIYDLNGKFISSSDSTLLNDQDIVKDISQSEINQCFSSKDKKIEYEKGIYFGTYRILYRPIQNKLISPNPVITQSPFCVLDVIYDKSTKNEIVLKTNRQIKRLIRVYAVLLSLAILFAYLLLKQITSPLRSISKHLNQSKLSESLIPLKWPVKDEVGLLVDSYNGLIKELEKRTNQLIKSEKEGAWKKMARQIAHEIKNPLTPMRLSVQYLQKSYEDGKNRGLYSDEWEEKLTDFSTTMIQQIDTLTRISNAFSDFASLNAQNLEKISIKSEIERIVNVFKNNNVKFISLIESESSLHVLIDKSHLTRVLNNLIKNSLQSERPSIPIEVVVKLKRNQNCCTILVEDNGAGVSKAIQDKIFEPNFTTKNSGMGLGLAMVKKIIDDLQGTIGYTTSEKGTIFKVEIPIINK